MKNSKIHTKDLNLYYGSNQALKNVTIEIDENKVTALIGPSGCGKSTFLRTLNRLNDTIDNVIIKGEVLIDDINIYDKNVDVVALRKRVGMIFQKSNPFPKSVYENVAYGPRINGVKKKNELDEIVETSCKRAAIWDEVKDRMNDSASALDPISTAKIEELMYDLKKNLTIVIVTHNMQQAARVSDKCAFFLTGEIVEYSSTKNMFTKPEKEKTENYISGRFG